MRRQAVVRGKMAGSIADCLGIGSSSPHQGLSSRAKLGILVFARGGSTGSAGNNQDPSLRSG